MKNIRLNYGGDRFEIGGAYFNFRWQKGVLVLIDIFLNMSRFAAQNYI